MIKKITHCFVLLLTSISLVAQSDVKETWLSALDLSKMSCAMGLPKTNLSIKGDSMSIGRQRFTHGVGTHATSSMLIDLHGG
jgi:hypothetical protein